MCLISHYYWILNFITLTALKLLFFVFKYNLAQNLFVFHSQFILFQNELDCCIGLAIFFILSALELSETITLFGL